MSAVIGRKDLNPSFCVPPSNNACDTVIKLSSPLCCPSLHSLIKWAVERVVQNIAQGKQAYQVAAFVDDDEAVHARLADCVEDSVEAVVEGAGVNPGEVL